MEETYTKEIFTGLIFRNRKEACRILGQSRYRKMLKNHQFIFNYTLQPGEKPIDSNFS